MNRPYEKKNHKPPPSAGRQAEEEEAAVAIERYRDLAEGIDHGIVWEADEALRLCMVSRRAERITGYSLEAWCGEPDFWEKHLPPEDRDRVMAKFRKALEGEDVHSDHRFIAADGHILWFHTGIHAARMKGKIVYRGLSVDITYLKETEEKLREKTKALEEANRVKSYFLSIASHEIRTALNAILGYASLLKEERTRAVEERKEIHDRVYSNASNLLDLINQILDLNKLESGQADLRAEVKEVSLSPLVKEVLQDHRVQWEKKGLDVALVDDPTAPVLRSDPVKLRRIFANLLINAVKFTERGAITVTIINHHEEKNVSVEIEDTGRGIAEEDLPRLFEPFYRTGRPEEQEGAGLGLAIVKQFVDSLKGTIEVKSGPAAGATFTVTLPYEIS